MKNRTGVFLDHSWPATEVADSKRAGPSRTIGALTLDYHAPAGSHVDRSCAITDHRDSDLLEKKGTGSSSHLVLEARTRSRPLSFTVNTATILNVDDDGAGRTALTRILQKAGFQVLEGGSGADALRLVVQKPDLILLDVHLQDINGFEVCRRIRSDPVTFSIPILHISTLDSRLGDKVKALEEGADGYLVRPVEPTELVATIKTLLRARQAEEALRENEERLQFALTAARMIAWEWDLRTDISERVCKSSNISGLNMGTGENIFHMVHPDDRVRVQDTATRAARGAAPYDLVFRIITPDGRLCWVEDKASLRYGINGQPTHLVGVCRDITQRKTAEELLLSHQEQLQKQLRLTETIAKQAAEALFLMDTQGYVTFMNPAAEQMLGWKHSELANHTLHDIVHHQHREEDSSLRDHCPLKKVLDSGVTITNYEDIFYRRDGTTIFVHCSNAPVATDEALSGAVLVVSDITAQKKLEERLREHAKQLAEADRRKDEFLAVLGHELRNPLTSLCNVLETLRLRPDDPATVIWSQDIAGRQVQHLSRLVDDLLDIGRISRGKLRLERRRIDLVPLVAATVEDLRRTLEQAGLTLLVRLPDQPVWVQADSVRIAQVLSNLLTNAAKFTDPGGWVGVWLKSNPQARQTVLTVKDTGIGLEPEMLHRVWDTYAQADRSVHRSRGGLGLGLALVRGLIEMHGGGVEAASDGIGRGSSFRCWLPLDTEAAHEPTATMSTVPTSSKNLRILVIEDNRDAAQSLQTLLELYGHETRVAFSGLVGVESAKEWLPDVVLADISLPGMSGYDVAQLLSQEPTLTRCRLIAMSGYGSEASRERCLRAGFERHLVKPLDPKELKDVLLLAREQR